MFTGLDELKNHSSGVERWLRVSVLAVQAPRPESGSTEPTSKPDVACMSACNPSAMRAKARSSLGHGGHQPSSRFSERSWLKGIRQRVLVQDTQHALLTSVYAHRHLYPHTHISTYTTNMHVQTHNIFTYHTQKIFRKNHWIYLPQNITCWY